MIWLKICSLSIKQRSITHLCKRFSTVAILHDYIHVLFFLHFRGLHSIDLIVSKLGHRIEHYLDSMLKILLGITGTSVSCLEHREEISPSVISPLKNVRHTCVDSLTKVCYCIEEISPSVLSPMKNIRHMCVDSLTKVCYCIEEISPSVISPQKNVRHMCVDSLTKVCYCIEEISPSVISPLKNVRHMCVDSLTKVCYCIVEISPSVISPLKNVRVCYC